MKDADCNEDDGFDETLVPCDYTRCGQIPDDALWKKLVNMDALHRELSRKRMSQKPQLSSSQKFELDDRAFSLTSGIVGNANANLGRPPRPPGFKKRPNTAGAQPMGGLPIEEFLAVMNGGDSGDLVGKLMQLGISLASNAG